MFRTKKGLVIALVATFTLGAISFAAAEDVIKQVTASINYSMKMTLNGQEFNPMDTDGTAYKPLIYNGRSYLPVRALADALKTAVDYDENTQTIMLGERTDKVNVDLTNASTYGSSNFTEDFDLLATDNKTYNSGFIANLDTHVSYNSFVTPNKKYQKFGGEIYLSDSTSKASIIRFRESTSSDYWDGKILKEITVNPGQTVPFEFNVAGIETLVISESSGAYSKRKMILGNPYFK